MSLFPIILLLMHIYSHVIRKILLLWIRRRKIICKLIWLKRKNHFNRANWQNMILFDYILSTEVTKIVIKMFFCIQTSIYTECLLYFSIWTESRLGNTIKSNRRLNYILMQLSVAESTKKFTVSFLDRLKNKIVLRRF